MKIVVVGAGKLGTSVTKALTGGSNEITVIDKNESVTSRISNTYDVMTKTADARDTALLNEINISSYDCIITCTDDDEKNIFIGSAAKKLGCKMAIARVRDPEHVYQLDFIRNSFNLDYVVNADLSCAAQMFKYLTEKYGISGGQFSIGKTDVIEFDIRQFPEMAGKALKDTAHLLDGLLLAAISRNGKIIIPNGNTELLDGDHLYVTGLAAKVKDLKKRLKSVSKDGKLKKVMIAGGGKTGFFLAHRLCEAGIDVKIIESDRKRCEFLSEKLDNALVLHGNASDINLLVEENLDSMNAFVASTGYDEGNILLSIMAQQHNIKDVIAKVSKNYYSSITDDMDDTMIINPVDMCTSSILRKLSSGSSVKFTKMIQGQAEFVEVYAEEDMILTSDTLAALDIPEGVLIAAINRNSDVIIPGGSTKIEPGDKVIILSLLAKVAELETLFAKGKTHTL